MTQFLKVPGKWLAACGYGNVDRIFPVTRVQHLGEGRTFVSIDNDGRPWQVWLEERGAILLTVPDEVSPKALTEAEAIAAYLDAVLELDARYTLLVNDGEVRTRCSRDVAKAVDIITSVDEAKVTIQLCPSSLSEARISVDTLYFVMGNDPSEVLCDHSENDAAIVAELGRVMQELEAA